MGFEFSKCCFCIELRKGCLIIGYLQLIMDISYIVLVSLGLFAAGVILENAASKEFQDAKVDMQTLGTMMYSVLVAALVVTILLLAFTIVLLVGLHKKKRGHVKAYLVYLVIFLIVHFIVFFAELGGTIRAGDIISQLVTILVLIYFFLVIRSYYLKMNDPAEKPVIYNTAQVSHL